MKKLIRTKFFGVLLLLCGLGYGNALSQTISISIPDTTVDAGETITIPVSVSEILESDNIFSGEWKFTSSSNLITFQDVSTSGTILDGINSTFNSTSGNFAFAAMQPVTGEGLFLNLTVQVREDAVKFEDSEIGITDGRFNEGEPQLASDPGVISVRGIEVTPKEPSGALIEGQSFQFSVNGNITEPVTWTSSDTNIATVSSTGLVEGIIPGTVKIYVEDAAGLTDSTDFFRVEPISLQELTLGVSDRNVTQTLVDSVQVNVSDLTGLNITSGQFDLSFTSSKLEILSISTEGTILEGKPDPTYFLDGNLMRIAFADSEPYEGEGALMNIVFRVNRDATGTASFIPQNVLFNEDFEADANEGTVTIENAPEIIVNQPQNELTIGESQIYSVETGGTAPYRWNTDDESVAVIDENTGELQALSRGTVNITAVDSDNFESEPVELRVNDVTVSVADTTVQDYQTFTLPIETSDLTDLGIVAYEIDLDFDPALLNFESIESAGTISDGLNISNSVEEGVVKVAAAGTSVLSGEGTLLNVNFSIQDTVSFGSSGVVDPVRVQFNEPGPSTPTASRRSATISFSDSVLPDQITLTAPENGQTGVPINPEFVWGNSDGANEYELEIYSDPDLTQLFTRVTGLTESSHFLTEDLNQLSIYYWRVRAIGTEGAGPWSETWNFETVPGVAAAPVLMEPSDQEIDVPINPTLRWMSSTFAESYVVELTTDPNFETIDLTESVTDTLYQVDNLQFETVYYWRVKGVNELGEGNASDSFSFTTEVDDTTPPNSVDAELSSVVATTPHLADGEDQSFVTVTLIDTDGNPVEGMVPSDLTIQTTGSAEFTLPDGLGNPGEFGFTVTNSVAEIVTVTVTADGVELNEKPEIEFEEPLKLVDADLSTVTATTPHDADGEDSSMVVVQLADSLGNPIERFSPADLQIDVSGSAEFTGADNTGNPGEFAFSVTNSVAETVSVSITVDDVLLTDQPEILFEEPLQLVDADLSTVTATTPHDADGADPSTVVVQLADSLGNPIERFSPADLQIDVSGSAEFTGADNTGNPGEFAFTVTNTVAETVSVSITVDDVLLTDQPEILFEEPIQLVDADLSTVTATTPHLADGEDQSFVRIQLSDSLGNPIDRFQPSDIIIDVNGSAEITSPDNLGNPGEFGFTVRNTVVETVTVTITVDDVQLTDQPQIIFQEVETPLPVVNADSSSVSATSPHFADGVDASEVTIVVADSLGEAIGRYTSGDIDIQLNGAGEIGTIESTGDAGIFRASITSLEPGTVSLNVTVDGVVLTDQPEILFEEPIQLVDADLSTVTATTPHDADGADPSTVVVQLADSLGNPIERFSPADLQIDVSGSAEFTGADNTGNPGEFAFSVTNSVAETVSVSITVDDVQLTDLPEIVFEEPIQLVDADSSTVTATSPHLADGEDRSTVIVQLADSLGDPIDRFNPEDLLINVTGDAQYAAPDVTGNPGEYVFSVSNTVAETVSVSISVDEVQLSDQPEIVFEEPIQLVDADSSTVTATSPHLADGNDQSTVVVQLSDSLGNRIDRFTPEDLLIEVSGSAQFTNPDVTGNIGEFIFTVTNSVAETVTVSITVDDVLLTDQPEILFEEPIQLVDADLSTVTATTPHDADGADPSTVVVQLADSLGNPIERFSPADLQIGVTGSAEFTGADNTGNSGEFAFTVTNTVAETVSVSITVDDVQLADQPEILFEEPFVGVPSAPELTSVESVETGANLNWSVSVTDHIDHFLIYRGESPESLTVLESVGPEVRNYLDSNPLQGASVYALTAVNRNGEESELSNIIYYINSEIVASTEWQLSSTPLSVESDEMDLATIYSYSDRYDLSSTFIPGRGYWIKTKSFDNETIPAAGQGLDSLSVRLNSGWNLIGSLSEPVSIFAISDPEELLTETPVYLYKDGNYAATDELIPNSGHWIYAREDGNITITVQNDPPTAGMELADSETDSELNQELARIQFISGSSSSELVASQVYLSEAEQQSYLLPPVAPDPVLDVRSENHSKLINNEPTEIQINSKHYPIEIKIEGLEENSPYAYRIYAEKEGVSRTIDLTSGGSEILDQEYDHLEIEMIYADEVVTENQLLPNYPNPFNPSTTIQYQLREQTHVMIEVYDVIGRRIQLLANETQLSGEHRVNFDGTNLSSGLYFIRFQAGNVVDIRKMTLIK
ncbi:Ig-like domain-containing protein [Rhodohalobacter barkolensis]|nr:invasin domain 3-containing protein [Rhodohalobacter barkolensis]